MGTLSRSQLPSWEAMRQDPCCHPGAAQCFPSLCSGLGASSCLLPPPSPLPAPLPSPPPRTCPYPPSLVPFFLGPDHSFLPKGVLRVCCTCLWGNGTLTRTSKVESPKVFSLGRELPVPPLPPPTRFSGKLHFQHIRWPEGTRKHTEVTVTDCLLQCWAQQRTEATPFQKYQHHPVIAEKGDVTPGSCCAPSGARKKELISVTQCSGACEATQGRKGANAPLT